MFRLILFSLSITLSLYSSEATYNPIPIGSVIVTTQSSVIAIQTQEYGGNDKLDTIYQAPSGITILNSVLDATSRSFSIIYRNSTANNAIIMRQLISRQQLSSAAYELAVNFTNTLLVTSDVARNRAFGTYDNGRVVLFSLSGLLETTLTFSTEIQNINLVVFNPKNYRLYIITKDELYSCANFDTKQLNCCKASITINNPRWIYFDPANALLQCSVLDGSGRMYQFQLDSMGCPTDITSEQLTTRASLQLAVDQQYVFAATSSENALDNSYLLIRNPTIQPHRFISVGSRIVALQIAYPSRSTGTINPSMCFYGITYNDYRTAVILAAVFGTIMGILMCFNVLFCIDFFMTKSVIRTLKSQIPHDLLEDRWNKLVEEKYAKIALESKAELNLEKFSFKNQNFIEFIYFVDSVHRSKKER